jgi:hypothetical protein
MKKSGALLPLIVGASTVESSLSYTPKSLDQIASLGVYVVLMAYSLTESH